MASEQYENLKRLHDAHGGLNYALEVFGDTIAKREKYKALTGMEAIHFYLIQKYSWLPRDVVSMSPEQIRFLLSEEMHGWSLPKAARS